MTTEPGPQNQRLFDLLGDLLRHSLRELASLADEPYFIQAPAPFDVKKKSDNTYGVVTQDTWIPVLDITKYVQGEAFQRCKSELFEDPELRQRLSFVALSAVGGGGRSFEQIYRHAILAPYVRASRSHKFDAASFDRVFSHFEAAVFSDERVIKSLLPICGIESGPWLEYQFEDGVEFRQLDGDQLGSCIRSGAVPIEIWSADSMYVAPINRWALVATLRLPVVYKEPSDDETPMSLPPFELPRLRGRANRIVSAARLVGGGSVVATRQVTPIPFTLLDYSGSHLDEHWVQYSQPDPTKPSRITEGCAEDLWSTERLVDAATRVQGTAIRRLVLASLRNSDEDAIVDLAIALESAFSPDSRGGEIKAKVSLHAALVAPAVGLAAPLVHTFVKNVYDLRSRFVHGAAGPISPKLLIDIRGEPTDLAGVIADLDSFLRNVVRLSLTDSTMLDHASRLQSVLQQVDRPASGEVPPN